MIKIGYRLKQNRKCFPLTFTGKPACFMKVVKADAIAELYEIQNISELWYYVRLHPIIQNGIETIFDTLKYHNKKIVVVTL